MMQEEALQAPNSTVPRLHCLAHRVVTPEASAYQGTTTEVPPPPSRGDLPL